MKIRNGFVSNSSSSSFIIVMAEPLSKLSIREMFGNNKWVPEAVVEDLFNNLHNSTEAGIKLVPENLLAISKLVSHADGDWYGDEEDQTSEVSSTARELVDKYPGELIFHTRYSDEDGEGEMEHGDHWRKAGGRVLRFSHH